MPSENTKLIEIFYSYASTEDGVDEKLQQQLEKHLGILKRLGKIANWHKRNILAGQIISEEVHKHINSAQIILLLISPDFVASDDCWDIEMERALERQKEEKTLVIPVLLRPLDYKDAPFSDLRVLPKNGKPVTSWPMQDEAFEDIARNIRLLAESFEETGKISWQGLGVGVAFAVAISTLITSSTASTTSSVTTPPPLILYQADWSTGKAGWSAPSLTQSDAAWSVANGELMSDGRVVYDPYANGFSTIQAPYIRVIMESRTTPWRQKYS